MNPEITGPWDIGFPEILHFTALCFCFFLPLFPLTPAAGWLPGSWCCSASSCKHRGILSIAECVGVGTAISIKIAVAPVTVCAFLAMALSPAQVPVLLGPAPSCPSPCSPYFSATRAGGTLYLPLPPLPLLLLPLLPCRHTTLFLPPFSPTSFAFVSFSPVHIKAIKFPPNSTIPSTK